MAQIPTREIRRRVGQSPLLRYLLLPNQPNTTAGIVVINWAAMEAWSWPQRMKLSIGRVDWMRWWNRSRSAFAGLSRAGGFEPIWGACWLRWSARTAGNWPRMQATARPTGYRTF